MITLYDYVLSGNCYKVRLFASLLKIPITLHAIDFYPGREHKRPSFMNINPLGELPVIDDDGTIIRDAQAILVYLATRYTDREHGAWYPVNDPVALAQTQSWLSVATDISATAGAARLHDMLRYDLDIDAARAGACRLFRVLDDHLHEQEIDGLAWLTGSEPSIADIACFPYVALARDGGIALEDYFAINRWIDAIKSLDGFISMPGISPKF